MGAAAMAGGAALVAFGAKAVGAFTDTAKSAIDMGAATGLAVEDASRWIAVGDDMGVSAEQLTSAFGKVGKSLDTGKWDEYGIAARDAAGEARSTNDILLDTFDMLSKVGNETERTRIGTELFGRGYASLAPLIGKSRKEMEGYLGSVEKGQVITAKEAKKAEVAARDGHPAGFAARGGAAVRPGRRRTGTAPQGHRADDHARHPGDQRVRRRRQLGPDVPVGQRGSAARWRCERSRVRRHDHQGRPRRLHDGGSAGGPQRGDPGQRRHHRQGCQQGRLLLTRADRREDRRRAHRHRVRRGEQGRRGQRLRDGRRCRRGRDLTDAYKDLKGELDQDQAWLNLEDKMRQFRWDMASGKLSIDDKRAALVDIKSELLNYLSSLEGVPAEKQTEVLALIDQGKLDEAEALLENLSRARFVAINPVTGGQMVNVTTGINGRRALGGDVAPGGTYLVGENGPEYLKMGATGGTVIPNHALAGTTNYFITNQIKADPNGFVQSLKQYERINGTRWRR